MKETGTEAPAIEPGQLYPGVAYVFMQGAMSDLRLDVAADRTARAYLRNVPPLEVEVSPNGPTVALDDSTQAQITGRARELVTIPYGSKVDFTEREMLINQGWLNGIAVGMTEGQIATGLGITVRQMKKALREMHAYLGIHNQPATVYSLLLHGVEHGRRVSQAHTPELTPNRRLQFYLGALGFELHEVVELLTNDPRLEYEPNISQVSDLRREAAMQMVGQRKSPGSLAKAIMAAFQNGYFTALKPEDTGNQDIYSAALGLVGAVVTREAVRLVGSSKTDTGETTEPAGSKPEEQLVRNEQLTPPTAPAKAESNSRPVEDPNQGVASSDNNEATSIPDRRSTDTSGQGRSRTVSLDVFGSGLDDEEDDLLFDDDNWEEDE
ncbi:MAG TPA: hypothetical protein VMB52_06895 [Verrucomicrobiae bacterium]|nr:hypothetical protein [Verrucomicrobiae bacterium]